MTRDYAATILPILVAYSKGKLIEWKTPQGDWYTMPRLAELKFGPTATSYRVFQPETVKKHTKV